MSDVNSTPTDPATLIAAIRSEMYDDPHIYSSSCRVCTVSRHAVMDDVLDHLAALSEEVSQLRRWKSEASAVIEQWESVFEELVTPLPTDLGRAKSAVLADAIRRDREEVSQLRTANAEWESNAAATKGQMEWDLHLLYGVWKPRAEAERALADQLAAALERVRPDDRSSSQREALRVWRSVREGGAQ